MTMTEQATQAAAATLGESYTTGKVHKARVDREGRLTQECGISRRQIAYLAPALPGTLVTCRRCAAA